MAYFLATYFLLLVVYAGYSIAGIYHLRRFGYSGDLTRPAIITYVLLSLAIIFITIILISLRQWPVEVNF